MKLIALSEGEATAQARPIATPVDWLLAPDWLAFEEACFLTGWDTASMLVIISEGGVDLDNDGLIDKQSLYEFQEALALVLHWED